MRFRLVVIGLLAFAAFGLSEAARSQQPAAPKAQKPAAAPAPRHDISGIWGPATAPGAGIQANGVFSMPEDGKPEHVPPYSALGLKTMEAHKPLFGPRAVFPSTPSDDPRSICDPLGFPRADFYQIRYEQFIQNDREIVLLYELRRDGARSGWTGSCPRKFRKSAGTAIRLANGPTTIRWTFKPLASSANRGLAGRDRPAHQRPRENRRAVSSRGLRQSGVDGNDRRPVMYTKPWVAMNKFPMKLQPPDLDIWDKYQEEMICSPSDFKAYNESIGGSEYESK